MTYEEQRQVVNQLIKEDKYPDALIACSRMLLERPKDEQSQKKFNFLFKRIIDGNKELIPETALEFWMKGIAEMYSGEIDDAIRNLSRAIELDKKNDYYFKCRAFCHNLKQNFIEAIADLEIAISLKEEGEYYDDLADNYSRLNDFNKAMRSHEVAIEKSPENARLWYNYGYDLQYCGQLKEAAEKYEKALSLWPEYEDAKANLAFIKLRFKG